MKPSKNPEIQKFFYEYCKIEDRVTKFVTHTEGTKAVCCTCAYTKPIEDCKVKEKPKEMNRVVRRNLYLRL